MSNSIKITALTVQQIVLLLKKAGSRTVTEDSINADIENGCPVNNDGTINFCDYAAWLVKETGANDNRD